MAAEESGDGLVVGADGGAADAAGEAQLLGEPNPDALPPSASVARLQQRGSGSPEHPFSDGVRNAMNKLTAAGLPAEGLRPEVPLHPCQCGLQYTAGGYVQVTPLCIVDSMCGVRARRGLLRWLGRMRKCTTAQCAFPQCHILRFCSCVALLPVCCPRLWGGGLLLQVNDACPVYLPHPELRTTCKLFALDCPNSGPECRIDYDGAAAGLYRYSNQCIVATRLLYKYLDRQVDTGMSGRACCIQLQSCGIWVRVWGLALVPLGLVPA